MRNKIFGAVALSAALLTAGAASAGSRVGIYYLSDLCMSQSAFAKAFGTKANAKLAQDEIRANPEATAAIRAQGINIKNVILAKDAFDGSRVYYVK